MSIEMLGSTLERMNCGGQCVCFIICYLEQEDRHTVYCLGRLWALSQNQATVALRRSLQSPSPKSGTFDIDKLTRITACSTNRGSGFPNSK